MNCLCDPCSPAHLISIMNWMCGSSSSSPLITFIVFLLNLSSHHTFVSSRSLACRNWKSDKLLESYKLSLQQCCMFLSFLICSILYSHSNSPSAASCSFSTLAQSLGSPSPPISSSVAVHKLDAPPLKTNPWLRTFCHTIFSPLTFWTFV